LTLQLKQLFQL